MMFRDLHNHRQSLLFPAPFQLSLLLASKLPSLSIYHSLFSSSSRLHTKGDAEIKDEAPSEHLEGRYKSALVLGAPFREEGAL